MAKERTMSFLLLLPIFFIPISPIQDPVVDERPPVAVVSFKWFKDRRQVEDVDIDMLGVPAQLDPIARKRNWDRNRRLAPDPSGARDPNSGTIEQRSAALERIALDARENSSPPLEGFTYQAKIQNNGTKAIRSVFWEFQFTEKANPTNVSHRQFVCTAKTKPEKRRSMAIFTPASPSNVISLGTLKKNLTEAFHETVIINRVEYEDGSFWQRKGWDYDDVKLTVKPVDSSKFQRCQGL